MTQSEFILKYAPIVGPEILDQMCADLFPVDPFQCEHSEIKSDQLASATRNLCLTCNKVEYTQNLA